MHGDWLERLRALAIEHGGFPPVGVPPERMNADQAVRLMERVIVGWRNRATDLEGENRVLRRHIDEMREALLRAMRDVIESPDPSFYRPPKIEPFVPRDEREMKLKAEIEDMVAARLAELTREPERAEFASVERVIGTVNLGTVDRSIECVTVQGRLGESEPGDPDGA